MSSSLVAQMVRWLPKTRCFMPSSCICFRIMAAGPMSVQSTIASTRESSMTCKLAAEIGIAGHEFLFDHDRMAEAPGCIAEFQYAESAVAVIDAQNGDALADRVQCKCGGASV